MSTDIETAFHTSLDRLLRGEATLDACVAAYPEHEERLRDMLVVALDLQALAPLPMDRQSVDRGAQLIDEELQRLRARQDRQPEPVSAWELFSWWFPRFMPVRMAGLAAAFAIALIAYGGVTLAAVNSGPDSALYGYRLTLEELRIGFAPNEEKAYLYLDTAEQRLREIESAAGTGDTVAVARASTAYQEVVRKGVDVLGAVARDAQPGAERTGDVAEDYRRRLAEHDTRFNSLTHAAAEAQRVPITRARSQAKAGLQDVHSGPILLAAPTATPDPGLTPTAVASAPASSPSPTPAALTAPTASPTPAAPTATPTTVPTPHATPEPTPTAPPVPAIDVTGTAVVVTGELLAVTDETLVVAGIPIARGEVAAVDAVPITARVRAEAMVDADGSLKLVGLSVIEPAAVVSEPSADGQPTVAPEPSPSPEPTPAGGTPPPTEEPTPEATATATPAEGEATATPEASPTPEPTASESTPAPDISPTPTAAESEPTATPEAASTQATTPGEGEPTPTAAEGEPTATPEATPPAEPSPTEAPEAQSDVSPTPTVADGTPSPTPEATPSPETTPVDATPTPTPAESAPTATPEATPSPEPTPAETAPPAEATPPADVSPTPTPETTETPTPTAETEPPGVPEPPTLQGILVSIDSFSVRAGGIVFSRPLDTPLVLHGPMAPGEVVLVTFEALRAASSYVLVAREVAPVDPPDGPVVTRWQGFVDERAEDALTLNGVRVQIPPEAREDDVWTSLEAGALVEVELRDGAAAEPVAAVLRVLGSSAAQSFSNLAGPPQG